MVHADAGRLAALIEAIFVKAGCPADEAARIGASLTEANLTGHDSHGVGRAPRYVQWMREGKMFPGRRAQVVVDLPAIAALDGGHGFGQTVGPQATRLGVAKAKTQGLALVALRDAGHLGRIGEYAEMAAAEGLVSVHFVNVVGSILVAPFGGVERRLSTAPFCVGVPMRDGPPLILDFATSLVAEGKAMVASYGGKPLPADALIGPDGTRTGDPAMLYGKIEEGVLRDPNKGPGAIRAFGDHKGSGLAFMCEILGGALTGAGTTGPGKPFGNGMLSMFIDPKVIDPSGFFPGETARYVAYFTSAKPENPGGPVLVPGAVEEARRAERRAGGVPLTEATFAAIAATARELGVDEAVISGALRG